jgi:hypothetical protein
MNYSEFNAIDPDELIPGEEGYQQAAQTQKDENVSSGRRRRAKQEEPEKDLKMILNGTGNSVKASPSSKPRTKRRRSGRWPK